MYSKTRLMVLTVAVVAVGLMTCNGPSAPDLAEPEYNNPYDERGDAYIPTPDLNTRPLSSIRALEAVSGGEFETDYGKPVTAKGVCWSTEEVPTLEHDCTNDGQGHGAFTSVMSSLEPDLTYYARAYATNEAGTIYGGQREFQTMDGKPELRTHPAQEVRAYSARLSGEIHGDGGAALLRWGLCYAENPGPTTSDDCLDAEGHVSQKPIRNKEDLLLDNGAGERVVSSGGAGKVAGNQQGLTPSGFTGQGAGWSAGPGSDHQWDFRHYSKESKTHHNVKFSPRENQRKLAASNELTFSLILEGLTPGQRYYVRTFAVNEAGTSYGPEVSFTTRDGIVVLTTREPFDIRSTSARTGGNITDDGGADVIGRGVCYIEGIGEPSLSDSCVEAEEGTGNFEVLLEDLQPDRKYTVLAYGTNIQGTSFGSQRSFITSQEDSGEWPRDTQTTVVEVTNPATGRVWMDRNLGASRAAISSTDAEAFGDLYQWGRAADGHQIRTSATTEILSSFDQPGHGDFILAPNSDWRSPQNDDLWQGLNGTNNPCPRGYRLPTNAEWEEERQSWSSDDAAGALSSPLKLPLVGRRLSSDGSPLHDVGSRSHYWSSTVSGDFARYLYFHNSHASYANTSRSGGLSVRCILD